MQVFTNGIGIKTFKKIKNHLVGWNLYLLWPSSAKHVHFCGQMWQWHSSFIISFCIYMHNFGLYQSKGKIQYKCKVAGNLPNSSAHFTRNTYVCAIACYIHKCTVVFYLCLFYTSSYRIYNYYILSIFSTRSLCWGL